LGVLVYADQDHQKGNDDIMAQQKKISGTIKIFEIRGGPSFIGLCFPGGEWGLGGGKLKVDSFGYFYLADNDYETT